MKRMIFSVILAVAMMVPAMAQMTYRNGNTYTVGTEVMKKKAYEGYLKNTCPEAFNKFHNGLVVANVGWGLFAGGLAMDITGFVLLATSGTRAANNGDVPANAITGQAKAGTGLAIAGSILEIPGIVMLGVGYGRMHHAADLYNAGCANKTTAYLTPSNSGLGLALHF